MDSISEILRNWLLSPVIQSLKETKMQIDDLNTKLATVQTAITQLGTDLTAAIADLKAKIAAAGTGPDLTAQLATLDTIAASLGSLDTQAKAE